MNKTIFLILSLSLLFSCQKDGGIVDNTISYGSPVKVRCNLKVSTLDAQITKTNEIVDENSVSDLWVLQFNGQTEASTLIKADYYSSPDVSNLNLNLLTGVSQTVFFIANTGDNTMFNSTNAPLNSYLISTLKAKTLSYTSEADNFKLLSGKYCLRMTGIYQGDISASGTSFTVTLSRLCAKIVFTYTSSASVNAGEEGAIIKISSVALKNVPAGSNLLSNPSNTTVAEPASVIDYPATTTGVGETSGTVFFYMPENLRGIISGNTSPLQKSINPPSKASYLEVNGRYYPSGSSVPSKNVTYRIYLGKNTTSDYNINSNINHSLQINFKGLSLSDSRISVNDIITAAAANCHMLPPGSTIKIPIGIKGNGSASTIESGITVSHTAASVGILWQTVGGLITVDDVNTTGQTATISSNGVSGNALIAAYSGANCTGNILWSWHIWVTDYNPTGQAVFTFTNANSTSYIMMDRNLGALSATTQSTTDQNILFYQYGRKDPFPGGTYTLPATIATKQSMAYTINNPTTFVLNTSMTDWCSTTSDNWWQGVGGSLSTPGPKTIYDPCPNGWRVATYKGTSAHSPWYGLTTSNGTYSSTVKGWTFTSPYNVGFYPQNGNRRYDTGAVDNNQTTAYAESYLWSANPNGAGGGLCFRTGSSYVTPESNTFRAVGCNIRCIKE